MLDTLGLEGHFGLKKAASEPLASLQVDQPSS